MRLKKGIINIALILAVIAWGLSVNQEKVQASDADLGFEPYVTDYATPAKQETEWKRNIPKRSLCRRSFMDFRLKN